MKTAIFYGSTTGVTQDIAERVGKLLNADVFQLLTLKRSVIMILLF